MRRETRASLEAAALPAERRVLARRGWAGENRGLFEHPARRSSFAPDVQAIEVRCAKTIFHTRLGRRKSEVEVEARQET